MDTVLEPHHVCPQQWSQAVNIAREACARIFRDGRSPADAVRAYGLAASMSATWAHAINVIAEVHCTPTASRKVA